MDDAIDGHLMVVAKAPVPGRVKTRLCPPLTAQLAASVAEAALRDTLESVTRTRARHRVLALDGEPGHWLPTGIDVIPQAGGSFADRLEGAWAQVGGPGVQIGMDTPQVTPRLLDEALGWVTGGSADAVLGPAEDGGWWAIGFRRPSPGAFHGVSMSTPHTYLDQLARLREMGLRVLVLPTLRDLDTVPDAVAIAEAFPASRTARAVRRSFIEVSRR